ncbi:MAG TPA: hypothetical protein VGT05_02595 [Patescibacteria group bacterium]|nr:hypothetical protein [Patescibacteria group bacterium]
MADARSYLDTSFLSALIRRNIHDPLELQAIIRIHSFWEQGFIQCYVSEAVKKELEKIPAKYKTQNDKLAVLYMLLEKAEMFPTHQMFTSMFGGAPFGTVPFGGATIANDPIFQQLSAIFDREDAEHIFLCIKNGIPYFLTYDVRTILNRARQNKALLKGFGIEILSPREFEDTVLSGQK